MNNEKERLEKELRFLKESLEANIISEEEYEKGRARIEKRLDEIGAEVEGKDEELTAGDINEVEEEKKETAADILKEVEEEKEEIQAEKEEEQKELVAEEESEEEKLVEPTETKVAKKEKKEKPKKTTKKIESKEEKPRPAKQKKEPETVDSEEEAKPIAINRKTLRTIAIIAVIIMLILIIRKPSSELTPAEEFKPVCSTDEECLKTGGVGFCINPGTKEAVCEFQEPKGVELTIINDRTCAGCDTSKGLNFLSQLFPGIKKTTIDANTPEGRALINELGIKALPAYVLGSEVNQTLKFDRSRNIFIHKNNKYLVKPSIGSNYFFTRQLKPSTLDLFVRPGEDTAKTDNSMMEVVALFGNKITFNKRIVEKEDEERLEREIAINKIYPTYLINNQLKFTGTQAPEIIKRRFCYMNNLPECGTTLSLVLTN